MDINEQIFEKVKETLTNDNLLYKICVGEANEEEKEKWNEKMGLPKEINEKLEECCSLGYDIASQFDKKEENVLHEILEQLKILNKKVDKLL